MDYQSVWRLLLLVLLGLNSISKVNPTRQGIGFLVEGENLMIARSTENTEVNLLILGNFSKDDALDKLKLIRDKLDLFLSIPGVNETAEIKAKIAPIVASYRKIFPQLFKLITDLSLYTDNSKEPKHSNIKCKVVLPSFTTAKILEILAQVTYVTDQAEMDADSSKITDKTVQREILSALLTVGDLIEDLKENILDRKRIITTLLDQKIPQELPSYLETQACVSSGKLESLEILECEKEKLGMNCDLNLRIFKDTQELTTWVPVSYKGAQLMGQNRDQIFAKNEEGLLGLITCKGERLDGKPRYLTDKDCSFNPLSNKCSYSLDRLVLDDILVHCNFTVLPPKLVTRIKEGLLIMQASNDIEISEYTEDSSQKRIITPDLPLLLKTSKTVEIKIGPLIKKYASKFINVERSVQYSALDKQFQEKILTVAQWQDFSREITYKDGIDYGLLSAFAIVLPIIFGLCVSYCKRTDWFDGCKRLKNRKWLIRSQRRIKPEKENYQTNRKIIKNTELDVFKIERLGSH